jgi:hypothetical protein
MIFNNLHLTLYHPTESKGSAPLCLSFNFMIFFWISGFLYFMIHLTLSSFLLHLHKFSSSFIFFSTGAMKCQCFWNNGGFPLISVGYSKVRSIEFHARITVWDKLIMIEVGMKEEPMLMSWVFWWAQWHWLTFALTYIKEKTVSLADKGHQEAFL